MTGMTRHNKGCFWMTRDDWDGQRSPGMTEMTSDECG